MELKISRPAPDGLSPPDCVTDPEEKEISDDDDDDRNHKHRRRETRSQSLGRDQSDQGFTRPNRKRNRPFENGHPLRETDSRSHYNMDRDLSFKFEKRRPVVMKMEANDHTALSIDNISHHSTRTELALF